MAPKRSLDDVGDDSVERPRKVRKGFAIGPANLPDGQWKRKVTKIKHDLIHKAKIKKAYEKIKTHEGTHATSDSPAAQVAPAAPSEPQRLHPEREAMLEQEEGNLDSSSQNPDAVERPHKGRRRNQHPGYFAKDLAVAQQRRQEIEQQRLERERREQERRQRIAERERFRSAMLKARSGGKNGQRKLGRESGVLLDKVKRLVGQQS